MKYKHGKTLLTLTVTALLLAAFLAGCGAQNAESAETAAQSAEPVGADGAAALVAAFPTIQAFTQDPVDEGDLQTILAAGCNAPSAMNNQPWHFSVVTDADVLQQIADGMGGGMPPAGMPAPEGGQAPPPAVPGGGGAKAGLTDAPLAIIVSCREGQEFDAGLACQTMSIEARLLGYGSKIISSPTIALNGEQQDTYRELLGIPSDCSAAAVLLIGREDTSVDASTGATKRNPMEETVTFVEP